MQVILKALQEGHAVMYYCKAGKDRTGIVTALLLSVLGASDEQILADYHMCVCADRFIISTPQLVSAVHA